MLRSRENIKGLLMKNFFKEPVNRKIILLVTILFLVAIGIMISKNIFLGVSLRYSLIHGNQIARRTFASIIFRKLVSIEKDFCLLTSTDDAIKTEALQTRISSSTNDIETLIKVLQHGGGYEDIVFSDYGVDEIRQVTYILQDTLDFYPNITSSLTDNLVEIKEITRQFFVLNNLIIQIDDEKEKKITKDEMSKLKKQLEEISFNSRERIREIFILTAVDQERIKQEHVSTLYHLRLIRYIIVGIIMILGIILFIRTFLQIGKIIEKRKASEEEISKLNKSLLNELEIAESVQSYLLPNWLFLEKNIILSSAYTPSKKIGGDLFDIIQISDTRYVIYVGDISGHGVQAALKMTAVKSTINMILENEKENIKPYYIVNRLNQILMKVLFPNNYMTLLLCVVDLDENEVRYFNAGHPPIIQYNIVTKKAQVLLDKGDIPIGWKSGYEFSAEEENVIKFDENEILFLYTDGIFECENKEGNQLGIEGLPDFLEESIPGTNTAIISHKIKKSLIEQDYDVSSDDFTLLAFQKRPEESEELKTKMFLMRSLLINTRDIGLQCEHFVMERLQDHGLAARAELVANEFLNNIVIHGLSNKSDTIILMQLEIKDGLKMTFWDKGLKWYLPEKFDEDNYFEDKDLKNLSGRGIPIIYSLATKITRTRYDEINETVIHISHDKSSKIFKKKQV